MLNSRVYDILVLKKDDNLLNSDLSKEISRSGYLGDIIGFSFDGTGYGEDGKIWGGEVFIGNIYDLKRVAHFKYIPMYSANEGKVVIVADKSQAQDILNFLKNFELSANATIIGKIISTQKARVYLLTKIGTRGILESLKGDILPRIC